MDLESYLVLQGGAGGRCFSVVSPRLAPSRRRTVTVCATGVPARTGVARATGRFGRPTGCTGLHSRRADTVLLGRL